MQRLRYNGDPQRLYNKHVRFYIRDIYAPHDWRQILVGLHGGDLLDGWVVDLSDSGAEPRAFAVVEVEELKTLTELSSRVVVPVAKIVEVDKQT